MLNDDEKSEIAFTPGEREIIGCFLASDDINAFVEAISDLLGNPVAVLDATSKVVASSNMEGACDDPWVADIKKGYYSDQRIEMIIANDRSRDLEIKTDAPFVRMGIDTHQRIISNLWRNDNLYGTFVVLHVSGDINEIQKKIPLINKLTLKFLNTSTADLPTEDFYRDYLNLIFANLLKGSIKEADLAFVKAIETQLGNSKYYQLASVPIHQINQLAFHNLRRNFEQIFVNCRIIYFNKHMQILRSSKNFFQDDDVFRAQVEEVSERLFTYVCFSEVFTNILQVSFHYNRNIRALQLANMLGESKNVVYYQNYLLLDAVMKAAGDNIDELEHFISRKILLIREYDDAHNTELFETLHVFIQSREGYSQAAKMLHTHRNTVLYRINHIKELFDIDLSSFDEFRRCLVSCRIAEYMDILKKKRLETGADN